MSQTAGDATATGLSDPRPDQAIPVNSLSPCPNQRLSRTLDLQLVSVTLLLFSSRYVPMAKEHPRHQTGFISSPWALFKCRLPGPAHGDAGLAI